MCFSQVTLTKAALLYYEEDRLNFPMNDLRLFTLTNHQSKGHLTKSSEKSALCIRCSPVIYNYKSLVLDENCILKLG